MAGETAHRLRIGVGDGIELALRRFGARRPNAVLVWGHANGFASGSYEPFLEALAARAGVVAFDLRCHGESTRVEPPYGETLGLGRLVDDYNAVLAWTRAEVPQAQLFAGGHSLGALLALAANAGGAGVSGLVLIEAAVFPEAGDPLYDEAAALTAEREEKIPKRRRIWTGPDELGSSLRRAPAYAGMAPEALEIHCKAVLAADANGSYGLRCPPEAEAHLYGEVARAGGKGLIPRMTAPALLLGGDPGSAASTWVTRMQPRLHVMLPNSDFVTLAGAGHLVPLEAPARCAALVADWIECRRH